MSENEKRRMRMKFLRVFTSSILFVILIPLYLSAQTLGTSTQIPEGTCVASVAGTDTLCANASDHTLTVSNNAGAQIGIPQTFYTTTTYTNATTSFTNVPGLAFPTSVSRNYHAICHITWQGSTPTAGPKYQFVGPTAFTAMTVSLMSPTNITTFVTQTATSYSTALANTPAIYSLVNWTDIIEFSVLNSAQPSSAGIVQLMAAANGAGTLTIQSASTCTVQ
jgi:hypothetical protein